MARFRWGRAYQAGWSPISLAVFFHLSRSQSAPDIFSLTIGGPFAMSGETPRYRALEPVELQPAGEARPRVVMVGEEFGFDGQPSAVLLPLNAAARAARLERISPHHYGRSSVNPQRMARSLGFVGHDANAARDFIRNFVVRETARQTTQPSTEGK
jgi:hypothetical protein